MKRSIKKKQKERNNLNRLNWSDIVSQYINQDLSNDKHVCLAISSYIFITVVCVCVCDSIDYISMAKSHVVRL